MQLRGIFNRVALTFRLSFLLLIFCVSLLPSLAAGKNPPAVLDAGYLPALATADHFLQAWQSGDAENGIALLTSRAKQAATAEMIDKFFLSSNPSAYEIGRGKLLRQGRYEFPVVLVGVAKNNHSRRRFSSIIVLHSGDNDWAIDKLP